MKPFCEIIVSDVMPALRAVVTNDLSKTYGLSQVQISKKLGITQPAISQYKREMRGQKTKLLLSNKKITKLIKNLAHDIAINNIDSTEIHKRLCVLCRKIREEGMICELHQHDMSSAVPCKICFG